MLFLTASEAHCNPCPEFSGLCALWERLALTSEQADPFCCSPPWHLAYHQAFNPARRLCFRAAPDACLIFAEELLSPEKMYLTPIEASWLFGCPLLGKDAPELLADALDDIAGEYAPTFPGIVISGIRPEGRLAPELLRRFGRFFTFYRHASSVQCAASLQGGLDGFLSRRSANHRAKLRKAARQAREHGVCFERHSPASAEEAAQIYRRMLRVEKLSWKGIGQCGMAESPAKEFYAALICRLAASGAARIIFASHEGRDMGFIFGGMAGSIYRGQQYSYDATWKDWSIGNLLQLEKVTWLCEEAAQRYDMGPIVGPRMSYKQHWTEQNMEIQTWLLLPNRAGRSA